MKQLVATALACIFTFFPRASVGGDIPYTISLDSFVMFYSVGGAFHDDTKRWDSGVTVRGTFPLSARLHLSFSGQGGLASEFRFIGGGFTFQFVPSTAPQVVNQQAVEVVVYRTWRPYLRAEIGYSAAQAVVHVGLVRQQVVKDLFGMQGSGGIAYAINSNLEFNGSAFATYGASPDISMIGFGVCLGLRYNLF